jgi:ACT domain-containing protein
LVLRHLTNASIEKFRNAEAIGSGYSFPMALFRLSISLPDRPGSLGLLASAIGAAGGDIRGLVVLKSEDGRGYDDITVAVPGSDPTDLLNVLGAIGGVEVVSITPVE